MVKIVVSISKPTSFIDQQARRPRMLACHIGKETIGVNLIALLNSKLIRAYVAQPGIEEIMCDVDLIGCQARKAVSAKGADLVLLNSKLKEERIVRAAWAGLLRLATDTPALVRLVG
jgi:hypothetical protein